MKNVERNHGNYFFFLFRIFKRMTAYNEVINGNEWIKICVEFCVYILKNIFSCFHKLNLLWFCIQCNSVLPFTKE